MNKLSIKEKLGFSLGEIGGTISWQGMMFFLGIFYTDVFGLTATAAGFLLFLPRFLDAFVDPIVGVVADRTNTKWGKFRPYLLWFGIPFAVFMVLMYFTPNFSLSGKTVYAYVTYIGMMIMYSLIMTPFNALGGVITDDHIDRTSLQSYRFMMAFTGGIIIRGFTYPLVSLFGGGLNVTKNMPNNPQKGFLLTMVVFAVISLIAFLVTFKVTKERVAPAKSQKTSLKLDFKDLLKNAPWLIIFLVSTLNLIYVGTWCTSMAYYFKYYMTAKTLVLFGWNTHYDLMSSFNVFGSIIIILVLVSPLTKWLSARFGKRNILIVSFLLIGVSICGFYFCKPTDSGTIMLLQLIQSAAAAPTMPIIWSIFADVADFSEWKNNRRATGLVFSAVVFGQKAGIALGAAIPLWILGSLGYSDKLAVQPAAVIQTIRMSMSLIPGVIAFLTMIACFLYPLTNKKMDQIQIELVQRRDQQKE